MKKRFLLIIIMLFACFSLTGCSIILELIDLGLAIADSGNQSKNDNYVYPDFDLDTIHTVGDLYQGCLPSTGDAKALVLLIEFPDEPHRQLYTQEFMNDIFFGDGSTFESVASYYSKSSYGKLNITGEVLDWYETEKRSTNYERNYSDYTSDEVLKEALLHYYNQGFDFSEYDSNSDGYIDAVYGIYSCDYDEDSDVWWAYQTFYEDRDNKTNYLELGDVKFSNYIWASASFLRSNTGFQTNNRDTTTFIHETGHLFGLDDYYNYSEQGLYTGGLGYADMMDSNAGDHCSISKVILGWVEPTVVDLSSLTSVEFNLNSFTETGEVLMIPVDATKGIFSEYFLVELYTQTGLNASNPYFTRTGIRILHVDATIGDEGMAGNYFTYFNCDNSDTDHPFVVMMNAQSNSAFTGTEASNRNLYSAGNTFTSDFYNDVKGNFTLEVKEITENGKASQATILITNTNLETN